MEKFKNKIEKNENNKNEVKINNEIKINDEKNKLINEDIDQIIIKYKIDDIEYSKNIRIFGDKFVENNKNKCKIIVNGNGNDLSTHLNINKKQLNNNILEIKLKGIRQITDMSYMFSGDYREVTLLSSLPDISKWNISNVTTMENMFKGCIKLKNIPKKFKKGCIIF